jgi:hypothetical protein
LSFKGLSPLIADSASFQAFCPALKDIYQISLSLSKKTEKGSRNYPKRS